ncbi:MAG: hypothetical protein KDB22_16415 [Planctomycetales bacterium]|nr:hypothetical protein [Planctomycetales bacterium]
MNDTNNKEVLKPVKVIRNGAIAASIRRRQGPSGYEYYDFSLSRSWKAWSTGKEGYSPYFFTPSANTYATSFVSCFW